MRLAGALVLGLSLCGCPNKPEAPEFDPNDRLLQKLQAEQERLAKHPPRPKEPQPDPLAAIAAAPTRPETLGIPTGVAADLGPVSLTLVEVMQSQSVGSEKVSLATTDRFLRVALDALSTKTVELDLSGATLIKDERIIPLARDAQRAAHGSALVTKLPRGEHVELVLYFELPPEMVAHGLKIILTSGGSRVELALQ